MLAKSIAAVAALMVVPALADPAVNVYFGQSGTTDLTTYCESDGFEYVTLAFVNNSPEQDPATGYPGTNFAAHCGGDVYTNPSTGAQSKLLSQCTGIAKGIDFCQKKGKKVLLSIGGAWIDGSNYTVTGAARGVDFANFLWNAFGPYKSSWDGPRPFDIDADTHISVDGFDFDLEKKFDDFSGYTHLINQLRTNFHHDGLDDKYIITGAPECYIAQDAYFKMKALIQNVKFDALFIQFYNNPSCDYVDGNAAGESFNYEAWVEWLAGTPSAAAKLFIGLPGSPSTDGYPNSGYVDPVNATKLFHDYKNDPHFGGAMIWDVTSGSDNVLDNGRTYIQNIHDELCGAPQPTTTTSATTVTSTSTSATSTSTSATSQVTTTKATTTSTSKVSTSKTSKTKPTKSSSSTSTTLTSTSSSSSATSASTSSTASSSSSSATSASTASTSTSSSSSATSTTSATSSSSSATSTIFVTSSSSSATSATSATSSSSTILYPNSTLTTGTSTSTKDSQSTGTSDTTGWTTSTVYTTSVYTVTSCAATVTDCPAGQVTTETIALYTTICPATSADSVVVASATSTTNALSTGTPTDTPTDTGVVVVTATSTTNVPSNGTPTDTPTDTGVVVVTATSTTQLQLTTSTVYTTRISTVTACPSEVPDCPNKGSLTTETIALYTTVCPVTDVSTPSPTNNHEVIPSNSYSATTTIKTTSTSQITVTVRRSSSTSSYATSLALPSSSSVVVQSPSSIVVPSPSTIVVPSSSSIVVPSSSSIVVSYTVPSSGNNTSPTGTGKSTYPTTTYGNKASGTGSVLPTKSVTVVTAGAGRNAAAFGLPLVVAMALLAL